MGMPPTQNRENTVCNNLCRITVRIYGDSVKYVLVYLKMSILELDQQTFNTNLGPNRVPLTIFSSFVKQAANPLTELTFKGKMSKG